jgi:iron complex transport system permease protein
MSVSSRISLLFHSRYGYFLLMMGLLLMALTLNLTFGSVYIPFPEVIGTFFNLSGSSTANQEIIILFRLPKSLTAILAGAALATSGLQLQTLFQNPLAGPFVLGISSGASLGVALAISLEKTWNLGNLSETFFGSGGQLVGAWIGSATVTLVVLLAAKYLSSSIMLIVFGLMLGYATGAIVNILLYFSSPLQVQSFVNWTFGSFGGTTGNSLSILAICVVCGLLLAQLLAPALNPLLLGETAARMLGVNISRLRWLVLLCSSLLAGTVTAFCGPVAFIGVAVPHLCRSIIRTSDLRYLFPATALLGATFALIADTIAQMPGGRSVLPINSVTALVGAPVIAWFLFKNRSNL